MIQIGFQQQFRVDIRDFDINLVNLISISKKITKLLIKKSKMMIYIKKVKLFQLFQSISNNFDLNLISFN